MSRWEQVDDSYLWTNETIQLLNRIVNTKGNLIAVIGLQGIGKTTFCNALFYELQNRDIPHIRCKWEGQKTLSELIKPDEDQYLLELWRRCEQRKAIKTLNFVEHSNAVNKAQIAEMAIANQSL